MTDISLNSFFHRNSHLFTILGVFGALAVYFTQLSINSKWRRLGIVSSVTIFILVAVAIQKNVPPEPNDQQTFDFIINLQRQKVGIVVFYVAFYAVVISVATLVVQFSNTLLFLIQFFCFIGGIWIARKVVDRVSAEEIESLVEYEAKIFFAKLIRNAAYPFTIGGGLLVILWLRNALPLGQIIELQVGSFPIAVLIGILSGMTVGGAIWIVLSIMTLIIWSVLWKLRSVGMFDESWEISEEYTDVVQSVRSENGD